MIVVIDRSGMQRSSGHSRSMRGAQRFFGYRLIMAGDVRDESEWNGTRSSAIIAASGIFFPRVKLK